MADVRALAEEIKAAATAHRPLSSDEVDRAVQSLQDVAETAGVASVDFTAYRELLTKYAHESHKQWDRTAAASEALGQILGGPDSPSFCTLFNRVMQDGNWRAAVTAAAARPAGQHPWIVLVTGVNGARKTSCVYQPWFKQALAQALERQHPDLRVEELPDGNDSFFRQLDYMVATLANEECRRLYAVKNIDLYAALKDSIYARYRMLAEMLGIIFCREAQKRRVNIFVETSGRDIAMFKYVDQFFPAASGYRKLVVHFTINDLTFAERSVDSRMAKEMADGAAALLDSNVAATIEANAGGPYGSAALANVQEASENVWASVLDGALGKSGESWYKVCLAITGRTDSEWTVAAPERKERTHYPAGWLAAFKNSSLATIRAATGVYDIAPRQPLPRSSDPGCPSSTKRQKLSQE